MTNSSLLEKKLVANGFVQKKTNIGSIWTYKHPDYKRSTVNYHNNGTVCFNYLSKYKDNIDSLPFYNEIQPRPELNTKGYLIIPKEVGMDVFDKILDFIAQDSKIK